ncbi:MAG: MBL fold metallo-hydrolase [Halobacteriales archaeon]
MDTTPVRVTVETPDGTVICGTHATSARSSRAGATSSAVAIIVDNGEALLIDSGLRAGPKQLPDSRDTIDRLLERHDAELRTIVQTHWHFDHVGHTQALATDHDAAVVCHPLEQRALEEPAVLTRPAYIESFGGDPDRIAAELTHNDPTRLPVETATVERHHPSIEIDRTVEHGDTIDVGEITLEVIHTPGHTPGHLSVYNPTSGVLYTTDVMYWPTPLLPHPVGDVTDQCRAIHRCLDYEATTLIPGHGLPRSGRTDVTEYLLDCLLRHRQLDTRIRTVLARHGPLTIPDIHAEAMPLTHRNEYATDGWYGNAINCIQAHCRRLLRQARVTRRDDPTVRWALTDEEHRRIESTAVDGSYERDTITVDTLRENRWPPELDQADSDERE